MSGKSMSSDIFQGLPEMTLSELKRCALEQGGYETPELNAILYLHYKGYKCVPSYFELLLAVSLLRYASHHHFRLTALIHNVAYKITNKMLGRKIENLNRYTGLKTLFLDSNGLEKIENIEHLSELRCLFLNKNLIGTIENLGGLSSLVQLDLSDNKISHIQGLSVLPNLATLNLSRNYLSDGASISHLKECSQKLTTVTLSFNQLRGQEVMMQLFGITSLVVLEMKENPIVRELSHFRKKCIVGMPKLRSLDYPIFDEERLSTEAWAIGGREAEIKAKRDWKLEQNEKNRRNLAKFREWKSNIQKKTKEERHHTAMFGPTEQKQAELKNAEQLREARLQKATEDSKREKETFQITDIDSCLTKQDIYTTEGEDFDTGTGIEEYVNHRNCKASGLTDYRSDNMAKHEKGEEDEETASLELTELQQSNVKPIRSELADEKDSEYGSDKETDAQNNSEPLDEAIVCIESVGLSNTYSASSDNVGFREHYGVAEKDASCFSMGGETYHDDSKRAAMERLIQDSLALLKDEKVHGRKVNSAYAAKSTWGDDSLDDIPLPNMEEVLIEDERTIRSDTLAEEKGNQPVSRSICIAKEGNQEDIVKITANSYPNTSSIIHRVYKDGNGRQLSWEELEALPPRNHFSIFSTLPQAVVSIDDNNDEVDDGEVVVSTSDIRNRMLARLVAS